MKFVSTRGGVPPTSLSDAILAGLAPDGGLYVPQAVPSLSLADFDGATTLKDVALRVLAPFFAGDALAPALEALLAEAFTFDAPLRGLPDGHTSVLELFHGPTAAFKDFGARFLAACFRRLTRTDGRVVTVLVATSGDTGSAVGAAFHGMEGVRVVILYPDGRVSPRQAHQLGCFGGNVEAFKVQGTFDDCQRLVKQAFADQALRAAHPLASANSISLGRLLPQVTYYARAALDFHRAHGESLNVVVPTGNLGNAFACLLARAVGLPLGEVVLATNANRVLPDFFDTGRYVAAPTVATLANAMDVGDPSNVERLTWLHATPPAAGVSAVSVDDEAIRGRIRADAQRGEVWCPHTACAVEALQRRRVAGDARAFCVVATAHPAKFDTVVESLVGHVVVPPPALVEMLKRPSQAAPLSSDFSALRAVLETPPAPLIAG